MPVTIIVGAQFGGEGKGKIVSHLCTTRKIDYVVRCGGPNSGHTVYYKGRRFELRLLPAGFVGSNTRLLIAPGAIVNPQILFGEIELCGVEPFRVGIDRNTLIIDERDAEAERRSKLRERIGSTASGTGMGVAKRVLRDPEVKLAKDFDYLSEFITDVSEEVNSAIDQKKIVVIEGTQGFGLSLYHTPFYPYATSRDTTASGFLSEVGVSPRLADDIIMVVRTFPIRVEGKSGPLKNEISWNELQRLSGYPYEIVEHTTATHRTRRIGMFDLDIVKKAAMVNKPTQIALHGVDYLNYSNKGVTSLERLSPKAIQFVRWLESELSVPVVYIGTGVRDEDIIDRSLPTIKLRQWTVTSKR